MRVLDKILYKAKLQVGGKVIKTDKDYVENPDGILNSATIDDNKYTGIDKTKIISDKFNGQDVSTYRYKDVDYLLDYKPKGLNNIDYGISDKTYTKSVTPVSTTNTNSASTTISERSNPKFMPNDHFSTDMSKSTNTPPVLSTSTKPNGLNRGLFTTTEKADKSGTTLKPAPIISSVIGNTTSQQSTNNTAVQPASTTTTEPQKRKGFFSRLLGKKDNKVTSDNPTSSNSTKATTTDANITSSPEPTLPAKYSETTTSTTTTPTLATPSNNSVSTATTSAFDPNKVSNYKLDDMGAILDENGNKIPFSSFQEESAAKKLFWSTNKDVKEIHSTSSPVMTTTESLNQNPTQQATTNNAVVTEDGYSINENGILLQGGKPTSLSPEKNDAARARVIAKQKDLQSTQTSNIASQTNNVPTGQTTIPQANVGNNNTNSATSANRNPNVNPTSQLPITTTQTSVSDNANQIPTIGDVPTIKTNTGVNTTINQEAELSESAKNNNRYVYDDYNNVIYRPDGSKAELTSRQKRDLFYYRDNSDLPLSANKERAARIHGEQGFYKTLVGSNEKEGKAIAEKPTTDVVTDALYNGKDWNKDIYSFESKSGVVITPDGTRVTLPPDIAKDVRKSIGMYNNSGSPNEKGIQNAIRQGVEKVTNSSSPTSSTNKPTPVTEIKLPANLETPTSSQPKPVPVLGTDAQIKPKLTYPAQQPESVQAGVPVPQSQSTPVQTPVNTNTNLNTNESSLNNDNNNQPSMLPEISDEGRTKLLNSGWAWSEYGITPENPKGFNKLMRQTEERLQEDMTLHSKYSQPNEKGYISNPFLIQHVLQTRPNNKEVLKTVKVWNDEKQTLVSLADLPEKDVKYYTDPIERQEAVIKAARDRGVDREIISRDNWTHQNRDSDRVNLTLTGKERTVFSNMSKKEKEAKREEEQSLFRAYDAMIPAPGAKILATGMNNGAGRDNNNTIYDYYIVNPKYAVKNIDANKRYTYTERDAASNYHSAKMHSYDVLLARYAPKETAFQSKEKLQKKKFENDKKVRENFAKWADMQKNYLESTQRDGNTETYTYDMKRYRQDQKRKKEYRKKQGFKNQSGGYINKTSYKFI